MLPAAPRVILISPHVDAIRREFGRAFAEWHERQFGEAVVVEWRDAGGSSDALRFVQSEFARKPEGIGIDLFFGGGQEPFLLFADKKLAVRYEPPAAILAAIPQQINGVEVYDPGLTWFGAAMSSFGILQNTRVQRLAGLPRAERWSDLTQPRLLGWVGAGDPRNSGTMTVMYEAFLQFFGWDRGWQVLTQVAGNVRRFDRISTTTAKDVTLGETAYAFAIDFYGFSQVAAIGRAELSFVLPQDFAAMNPDGIAILKGAPHRVTAQRFVDFVLSEAGQKLWFLPRGHPEGPRQYSIERMSVRPDFYGRYRGVSNIEFSPFDLKQSFRYNAQVSRARRDVVAALFGALLVDTHEELQAAWRALIARRLPEADLQELGRMPVTEAEVLQLAAAPWKDPALRTRKKTEWQTWAQHKYRELTRGAPRGAAGRESGIGSGAGVAQSIPTSGFIAEFGEHSVELDAGTGGGFAGQVPPLTPALSPLRGEGARWASWPVSELLAAFLAPAWSGYDTHTRPCALELRGVSAASPSPLHGERAGVRGGKACEAFTTPGIQWPGCHAEPSF
jgi:ABC-type Fe3+ transport system substrate-binding protein